MFRLPWLVNHSHLSRAEFKTSDMFQPPIRTTRCGHNFCEKCLNDVSNDDHRWACPECRRPHNCSVDSLLRNFFIEKMVEKFKKPKQQTNEYGSCKKHGLEIQIRK